MTVDENPRPQSSLRRGVQRLVGLLIVLLTLGAVVGDASAAPPQLAPSDMPDAAVTELSKIRLPAPPSDYLTHDGGWIRFAYPAAARGRVKPLIEMADDARGSLAAELGRPVLDRVEVRIAEKPEQMPQLTPEGIPPPKYAVGVAYARFRLIVLSMLSPNNPEPPVLEEVFRHELAHVALFDAVGGHRVPRWFNEGFAVHASGESSLVRAKTLWSATLSKRLLPLSELDRSFPADDRKVGVAYAQSADFVRFMLRRQDRPRFAALIGRVASGQSFDRSLADAYGTPIRNLELEWRDEIKGRYSYIPVFLGGGVLWVGAFVVVGFGWVRRRRKHRQTLARWAKEEAAEDRRARERMRVTLAQREGLHTLEINPIQPRQAIVPKVEHKGQWHTLH